MRVSSGPVRGTRREGVNAFLGIPYAKAAVGRTATGHLSRWSPGTASGTRPHRDACAILTDAAFRVPLARLANAQHGTGGTVHAYEFAWPTPVAGLGACHSLELPFVFDTLDEGALMAGDTAPPHLAEEMHRAWVAFARDGSPGWRQWTPLTKPSRPSTPRPS